MGGVRARKTRRNKRVNTTRVGAKRKKKLPKLTINNPLIKQRWDKTKTLKQNMTMLGLATDPNAAVSSKSRSKNIKGDAEMPPSEKERENDVITEFEKQARSGVKTERIIAEGEAKFLLGIMKDYADDYKAMAKDKRNYYQHTPKQLKRKCEKFRASPYYSKYVQENTEMEVE